jgi:hypothetical protein
MEHEGYKITAIKERTLDHKLNETVTTTYVVSLDKSVLAVGLPSEAAAKHAIDKRRRLRQRGGLDPVG